ncbi:MAG: hypothetical protein ACSHYB_18880 [Roseibacillus sp.]
MKSITQEAWSRVTEVACDIINASEAGDDFLVRVHTDKLMVVLDELQAKFGEHPEFYDTRADFLDDPNERMRLYRKALQLAESQGDVESRVEILESISGLEEEMRGSSNTSS